MGSPGATRRAGLSAGAPETRTEPAATRAGLRCGRGRDPGAPARRRAGGVRPRWSVRLLGGRLLRSRDVVAFLAGRASCAESTSWGRRLLGGRRLRLLGRLAVGTAFSAAARARPAVCVARLRAAVGGLPRLLAGGRHGLLGLLAAAVAVFAAALRAPGSRPDRWRPSWPCARRRPTSSGRRPPGWPGSRWPCRRPCSAARPPRGAPSRGSAHWSSGFAPPKCPPTPVPGRAGCLLRSPTLARSPRPGHG